MFIVESTGQVLPLDVPFVLNDVQYPSNWIRATSPEEKAELGIIEVPDEASFDPRFFWGRDSQGALIEKDLQPLKQEWVDWAKRTAGQLISQTDWMVIRESDSGVQVPESVRLDRERLRAACNQKEAEILQVESVQALVDLVSTPSFLSW